MRTIRHAAHATVSARSGYQDDTGTLDWIVTVPWEDGPAEEGHGHPELPQLTLTVEGPDGDVVEDATLSADDTRTLFDALGETYKHLDRRRT